MNETEFQLDITSGLRHWIDIFDSSDDKQHYFADTCSYIVKKQIPE